jgi:RNA polymerase sigma factor (sigma-70 family)
VTRRTTPPSSSGPHAADFDGFYLATVDYTSRAAVRAAGGDRFVGQDATHDAYLEMFRQWPNRRTQPWETNRHFVVRIAVRRVADWYRRNSRWAALGSDVECPARDLGFVEVLDEMSVLGAVRALIKDQPPRRRAVAVLFFLENCTTAEVADTLGMTESTVRTHVQRLRRLFRPCVDQFVEIKRGSDRS